MSNAVETSYTYLSHFVRKYCSSLLICFTNLLMNKFPRKCDNGLPIAIISQGNPKLGLATLGNSQHTSKGTKKISLSRKKMFTFSMNSSKLITQKMLGTFGKFSKSFVNDWHT